MILLTVIKSIAKRILMNASSGNVKSKPGKDTDSGFKKNAGEIEEAKYEDLK
ncbi:MAG: hypothetical protein JNJ56_02735 [Ignavibacteria bacterium]|nr:hypothetical protein [Ignavibacteria bacterium]